MFTRLFTLFICCSFSLGLQSQFIFNPKLEVAAGISSFTPFEDFSTTVFTVNGNAQHLGNGNITEPVQMAFVRLGLAQTINDRWSVSPFVSYHSGSGTLFDQEFYIFGISDLNPEEQRYTFRANNSMRLFVAGADIHYTLFSEKATTFQVGTGLAFSSRSHTYRDLLEVDFNQSYRVNSQSDRFTTANRTAVGLPFSAILSHQLTTMVSIGLQARAQFSLGQEDVFWSTGLLVGVHL